jgi:hypothetical protein
MGEAAEMVAGAVAVAISGTAPNRSRFSGFFDRFSKPDLC